MTAATPGQAMAAPEDKTPPEYQLLGWAATLIACSAPGAAQPPEHWCEGVRNWQDAYAALVATPAAQEPQPAPGDALRERLKQLVVTLRRISDQQEASGHAAAAYATGCAATMVEALDQGGAR